MFVNLLLLTFGCRSPKSATLELDDLGVNFTVFSGESSTGFSGHQDEADLLAGEWALMRGEPKETMLEAKLWTPSSVPLGRSGIDFNSWGNVRLSRSDAFEVATSGESIELKNIGRLYPGEVDGQVERERSGLFSLNFIRDGSVVSSETKVFLARPSLGSHADGGAVELADGTLGFDLDGLDALDGDPDGWYSSNWWLVVICGGDHIFSGPQYSIGLEGLPDSSLNWDLAEIYDALRLDETAECELTLTEHSFGKTDQVYGSLSGTTEGFYTETFDLTFKAD
jgi:hypothetical protein